MPVTDSFAVEGTLKVFYIPDFVSEEDEKFLLSKINTAPKPKWKTLQNRRLQVWGGEIVSNRLVRQPLPGFLNQYPNIIGRLRETGVFSTSRHNEPNHVIINEYLAGQGIMPHEDGSSYYPTVATLSLGSHAVFNYYRYKPSEPDEPDPTQPESTPEPDPPQTLPQPKRSRVIDTRPVAGLLLEPRSLVITVGPFYTDHLHGIDGLTQDVIVQSEDGSTEVNGTPLLNWGLLSEQTRQEVLTKGGLLVRDTRVSLTCRDVENVFGEKRNVI